MNNFSFSCQVHPSDLFSSLHLWLHQSHSVQVKNSAQDLHMSVWESNSEPHKRGSKWTSTHTKAPPQMDGWIDEWMVGVCVCVCVCTKHFFMLYSCPKINHGELCTHHRLRIYIIAPKCLTYLPYLHSNHSTNWSGEAVALHLVSKSWGCNQNVVVTFILVTPLT
jgi:hypothetical protein